MKRRILTILAVVVGLLVTFVLVTGSMWPVLNDVKTSETPAYPDVLDQYFSADPKRVFDEAAQAVESLENWELVEKKSDRLTIEATRETTLGFTDDITITVRPQTEFVSRVAVHSRSRVGKGDFGQNARNIREFQAELDDRLGAVRFDPFAAGAESEGTQEKTTASP